MPLVEGISVDADPQTCGRHHGTVALAGSGVARVGVLCHQIARVRAKLAPGVAATGPWEAREQLTEVCHHNRHRAQQETACDRGRLEATQCPQDRAGHGALKSSSAAVSWPRDSMCRLNGGSLRSCIDGFLVAVVLQTSARLSINLTTATSGRRPAAALVQGPGVEAGKRVASIAAIAREAHAASAHAT